MVLPDLQHIVLIPYPAQGHFPPIVFLAKKLARLGCKVTIVTISCIYEKIKASDFPPELDIRLEPLHPKIEASGGVLAAAEADFIAFNIALLGLGDEFKHLLEVLNDNGPRVTSIVADHYVGPWCAPVANDLGVPHAIYWPGSATWLAVEYHASLLFSEGALPVTDGEDRTITYVPGVDSVKQSDLPLHYKANTLDYLRAGEERLKSCSWILCNTFYELEPKVVDAMRKIFDSRFVPIGPLFPVTENRGDLASMVNFLKEDRECLNWLDSQHPNSVLYVAFGSIAKLSQEQFEELALGLEDSGVPFLLTVRPPQFVDPKDTTVVTTSSEFYERFVERTKDRSLVVSWAPQREVLLHKSVVGFMTHCGWNSVFESISSGVPMICWPQIYEQTLNRKIVVEDCRVGVNAGGSSTEVVPRHKIAEAVRSLCKDEGRKSKAVELVEAAKRAAAEGGDSHQNLQRFVEDILINNGRGS